MLLGTTVVGNFNTMANAYCISTTIGLACMRGYKNDCRPQVVLRLEARRGKGANVFLAPRPSDDVSLEYFAHENPSQFVTAGPREDTEVRQLCGLSLQFTIDVRITQRHSRIAQGPLPAHGFEVLH